jgi:hypothetical protein
MPAKRIDEYCKGAAGSRETVDFEVYPIPSEQSHAAKNADNKKAKHKAAMQIDPKHHDRRQQKASRSFQAFSVENDAKQHGRNVWRSGEINVRGYRKRGIKQAREENGNTNRGCRGSAA